eukprot:4877413-Prorocentrum_lima.AAC.1
MFQAKRTQTKASREKNTHGKLLSAMRRIWVWQSSGTQETNGGKNTIPQILEEASRGDKMVPLYIAPEAENLI